MEFLTYLVELLKNNPGEFFTTILSYSGITAAFGTSIWGIVKAVVAIINKIRGKNLNTTLKKIVEEKILPLQSDLLAVKDTIEHSLTSSLELIQNRFAGELEGLNGKLQELLAQGTALAGTVLNTKELQIKYENLQKEFLLLKDKAINIVVESKDILTAEVNAVIEDIKPEVEQITAEVKKIKLKRK